MSTKKFPIAIQRKIELINSMIPKVNESEFICYTYNKGSYPYMVCIKPIVVKNQFVTIEGDNYGTFIEGKERYNVNKVTLFGDEYCRKHLERTLNTILKAFKETLKN